MALTFPSAFLLNEVRWESMAPSLLASPPWNGNAFAPQQPWLSRTSKSGWRVICISDSPYATALRLSHWQREPLWPQCLNSYVMAIPNGTYKKDVEKPG